MKHIVNGNWIIPQDTRREYILDILKVYDKEPKAEVRLETVKTKDAEETINEKGIWHLKNIHLMGVWTLLKKYNFKKMPNGHRRLLVISKPINDELFLKEFMYRPSSHPLDDPFVLPLEEVDKLKKHPLQFANNNHLQVIKNGKDKDGKPFRRNYGTVRDLDCANKLYEVMEALDFPEEFVTRQSPLNEDLQKIQAKCKNHSVNEVLDWIRKEYPSVCPIQTDICDTVSDVDGEVESQEDVVLTEAQQKLFDNMWEQKLRQMKTEMKEEFLNGNL